MRHLLVKLFFAVKENVLGVGGYCCGDAMGSGEAIIFASDFLCDVGGTFTRKMFTALDHIDEHIGLELKTIAPKAVDPIRDDGIFSHVASPLFLLNAIFRSANLTQPFDIGSGGGAA